MKIKNKVDSGYKGKLEDFNDLQPQGFKSPYHSEITKESIIKRGFVQPFAMCEIDSVLYILDGHLRKDIINELIADGHKVPKELSYYLVDVENDRKKAIDILLSNNLKTNPVNEEVLLEWLEVENIDIQEVNIESVNVVQDFSKGLDFNNMTDSDIDIEEEFNPIGTMDGKQRVVFLFDGQEEAESYLNSLKVEFKKMNMAWQVDLSTQFT